VILMGVCYFISQISDEIIVLFEKNMILAMGIKCQVMLVYHFTLGVQFY
jgi:hypothetical protein